jgi:membrane dipeptidase
MLIVDAHLDLAFNVGRGRDVTRPAIEQPVVENEIATVGLPDLRRGNVGLVCATIFAEPRNQWFPQGYADGDGAHAVARRQLDWYAARVSDGSMRLVRSADDLPVAPEPTTPAILLLEGADPIRNDDDVRVFHDLGVRIVGLAWKRTAHAGGTGEPGGLTDLGRQTVRQLDAHRMIHDTSHLAEQAFWELMGLSRGPIIASHSNCRAIAPGDRQLSDEMIRAIASRGGVIGINLFHKFLLPAEEVGQRRARLSDVVRHVRHITDLLGSARHVGLGTDMDGGLGREQIPEELTTSADLARVGEALSRDDFSDDDVAAIMGGNWLHFFRGALR